MRRRVEHRPDAVAALIVAHGSTRSPDSSAPARLITHALRASGRLAEARCAFWQEHPRLREAAATLACRRVVVLPVFADAGYFTDTVVPRELGLAGALTQRGDRLLRLARPVGAHPAMAEVLWRRCLSGLEVAPRGADATTLIVVAHGTGRSQRSGAVARARAQALRGRQGLARVVVAYLDQAPRVADVLDALDTPQAVIVPHFISEGFHTRRDLPALLGLDPTQADAAGRLRGQRAGRALVYTRALGADPALIDVALACLEEALSSGWTGAAPAPPAPDLDAASAAAVDAARRAFTEQLARHRRAALGPIEVDADADARWTLRPTGAQGGAPAPDLATLEALLRRTPDGAYRPLIHDLNPPTRWRMEGRGWPALIDACEVAAPGTIWTRLGAPVSPGWSSAVRRMGGRAATLDALDPCQVAALARGCAQVRRCARSPLWAPSPADAPGGACAEPCALALRALHDDPDDDE